MVIYTSNDIHPKGRRLGIDKSLPSHRRGLGQEFEGWLGSRLTDCSLEERVDNRHRDSAAIRGTLFLQQYHADSEEINAGHHPSSRVRCRSSIPWANWALMVSTSTSRLLIRIDVDSAMLDLSNPDLNPL